MSRAYRSHTSNRPPPGQDARESPATNRSAGHEHGPNNEGSRSASSYRRGRGRSRARRNRNQHGLTNTDNENGNDNTSAMEPSTSRPQGPSYTGRLNGGAAEFQPLQAFTSRPQGDVRSEVAETKPTGTSGKRKQSRSTALDVTSRVHEDISNGLYECAICTNGIFRNSKVWSCQTCSTVFHLSCIKKWSNNDQSTNVPSPENGDNRSWRCPGCNLPQSKRPQDYTCWCGKEIDPRVSHLLNPHSCGQSCGKTRPALKKCPHPCEDQCHAGPCPPCTRMGPLRYCFCGRTSQQNTCVETKYDTAWSCFQICNKLLSCGLHSCSMICHDGSCGPCMVELDEVCYCGQTRRLLQCSKRGPIKKSSKDDGSPTVWHGSFDCAKPCGRPFSCGLHKCELQCHVQQSRPSECPRSPQLVMTCPCGQEKQDDLRGSPRRSCEDQILNCQNLCSKGLPCGHSCQSQCHTGECPPCMQYTSIACRCGRTKSRSLCYHGSASGPPPQCMRICKTILSCGRHECGEHCCAGEQKASERNTVKKKRRPLEDFQAGFNIAIEDEHICTRVCNRPLKCGNHRCQQLCHKGPCDSCREASFDDINCNCGRTTIQAPVPCGTKPPSCRYDCERQKTCGHPQVSHSCHGDEEACPRCPFLTEKRCVCGRKTMKSIPCSLSGPQCGEVCGKMLHCQNHLCRVTCHRPGNCEDTKAKCVQTCGKAKEICSHPCQVPCHGSSACPEGRPCSQNILVTCDCQRIKKSMPCHSSTASPGNTTKVLKCDEECQELARKSQLADAFGIDVATHTSTHIPYSKETLKFYSSNSTWAASHEQMLRDFAKNKNEKRLRFKPMNDSTKRAFLHSLAEDFGLDSESMDPVPHRHVAIFKTPRFVSLPEKTLKQYAATIFDFSTGKEAPGGSDVVTQSQTIQGYNAFLLAHPQFGLTTDELLSKCEPVLSQARGMKWTVEFTQSDNEEVIIRSEAALPGARITDANLATTLQQLHQDLAKTILKHSLAESVVLGVVGGDSTVQRRKDDGKIKGLWCTIAAKNSAKATKPNGSRIQPHQNAFVVLSSHRSKRQEEQVAEDWEQEAEAEQDPGSEGGQ